MVENTLAIISEQQESNELKKSWRQLSVHTYVKIFIIGFLFYSLFHYEIGGIVSRWVMDSSWSHGFLIPIFSLYFVNQRKHEILNMKTKPSYIGLVLLVFIILFYPFNIKHLQYGYFRPLCMIAMLGSVVLFLGGWRLVKYLWLPVLFLIFAVPLPGRYYVSFTMPMRKLAALVATVLLNLVSDLEASASGVVITVIYKGKLIEPALDVADACSGMRLLMAFLALGVAMAYLHYRPIWQRIILLASTIPIAILCNVVRVTATGFIFVLIDPRYIKGFYHDMLGMAMLPLAFSLYGLLACFMSNLFVNEGEIVVEDVIIRKNES
ncbi:MAG: exosortase/archaeosortase family protein [Planctomycetota bacterium]|jgi:exosortase